MRLKLAILIGKLINFLLKKTGLGGGTTLPGLVGEKIDPQLVKKLTNKIIKGSIIISGTNGKTTTAKMVATILEEAGISFIHNRSGSNLIRGIASTLIEESNLKGQIKKQIAIFEVDEATVPEAIKKIQPRIVLITNFFRDQLDRYGELDTISQIVKRGLINLPSNYQIILNANDPFVAFLNDKINKNFFYFGITDKRQDIKEKEHTADVKNCPRCNTPYHYSITFFSHIGIFYCPKCHLKTPDPQIYSPKIIFNHDQTSNFEICFPRKQKINVKLKLPGIYNIYNALAASSISYVLQIKPDFIKKGLEKFSAAFGRVEKIKINNKTIIMFLVKNPTGANVVLKTLVKNPASKNFIMALNDNLADGTDVSWIWDIDFEQLKNKLINFIYVSGIRAEDLSLRLKYAGIDTNKIYLEKDYHNLIRKTLALTKPGHKIYLLATYTAMLDIRKSLRKFVKLNNFWENL